MFTADLNTWGASSVEGVGKDEFMSVPALGGSADRYFEREYTGGFARAQKKSCFKKVVSKI